MKKRHKIGIGFLLITTIGFFIPQNLQMPVEGATSSDYHADSFWYYPWGESVTHKGVDIFADQGTMIRSSTIGLVLYSGNFRLGGNVVLILGPKWRLHYYAHLDATSVSALSFIGKATQIGSVGTSGNAAGKSPHLHYSIVTLIPYLWRVDSGIQGWKKMFYLNPMEYL